MNSGRETGYLLDAMFSNVGATFSMTEPCSWPRFSSRKLKPKMPSADGFASIFWTIRLSFSPAST